MTTKTASSVDIMEEMRVAYSSVETYDDLLNRNIDYLNGRLKANPYTHSSILNDNDMSPLIPKLIELTKLGYYTITGQPNKAAYNVLSTCSNNNNNNNNNNNSSSDSNSSSNSNSNSNSIDSTTVYLSIEQRNYTSGLLEDNLARYLKDYLDNCKHKNHIYYRIEFDNDQGYYIQSNMPYNSNNYFNLSRKYECSSQQQQQQQQHHHHQQQQQRQRNNDYSIWNEYCNCWNDVNHRRNVFYQYKDYPKIMNIFLKCAGVYIVTKDYNSKISVEDIMKDFLISNSNNIKYKNSLNNNIDTNNLSIDDLMKQFSLDDDDDDTTTNTNNNKNNQKKKKNKKK